MCFEILVEVKIKIDGMERKLGAEAGCERRDLRLQMRFRRASDDWMMRTALFHGCQRGDEAFAGRFPAVRAKVEDGVEDEDPAGCLATWKLGVVKFQGLGSCFHTHLSELSLEGAVHCRPKFGCLGRFLA